MEKQDLRKLTSAQREPLRTAGIRMIKSGMRKKDIAAALGVHVNTVTNWRKSYNARGAKGLKDSPRGARKNTGGLLSEDIQRKVRRMITDTMPDQLKLPYGLWTRKAVQELVEREFAIKVARTTMGAYLRSWGFTPQKPKKKAYEQRPAEVRKWLEEQYPAIKERAKREKAEIHWGDETGARNDCRHGRSYAPKGKTPTREGMAKRFSVNMISTVTNQGRVEFMVYDGTMNQQMLLKFLEQLVKGRDTKLFLILDNLTVHHGKIVKEWCEKNREKIELFFLPAYSPEKNPDEYLNCDLKRGLSDKPLPKNAKTLSKNVNDHMEMLQNNPERVRSYFRHPEIAYAA